MFVTLSSFVDWLIDFAVQLKVLISKIQIGMSTTQVVLFGLVIVFSLIVNQVFRLSQTREYIGGALDRLLDKESRQSGRFDASINMQTKLALLTMLIYLLMLTACCFIFLAPFPKLVDPSRATFALLGFDLQVPGLKVTFWFVVAGITAFFAFKPIFSLIGTIQSAHLDLWRNIVGEARPKSKAEVRKLVQGLPQPDQKQISDLDRHRRNLILSSICAMVISVAALAAALYFVAIADSPQEGGRIRGYWRYPAALTLAVGLYCYLAAASRSASFLRQAGGFGYAFMFGAVIWSAVLLGYHYYAEYLSPLDPNAVTDSQLIARSKLADRVYVVIAALMLAIILIKYFRMEFTDYSRHSERKPDKRVWPELADLFNNAARALQSGASGSKRQAPLSTANAGRDYFENKRKVQLFQKSLVDQSKEREKVSDELYKNAEDYFGIPNADDAIRRWIEVREDEIKAAENSEQPYRIFVASAQGGGLYAAWYAAAAFAALQDKYPNFGRQLFATSAVSGGGVGAQLFSDLVLQQAYSNREKGAAATKLPANHYRDKVEQFFRIDYMTPLIGKLLFGDIPRMLLPRWLSSQNRAHALELAFDHGWDTTCKPDGIRSADRSFFDRLAKPAEPEKDKEDWRYKAPFTVINTTLANNGMPMILSPFYLSNFYRSLDELEQSSNQSEKDKPKKPRQYFRFGHFFDLFPHMNVPVTTAVSFGARFPYVTPGGRLPLEVKEFKSIYKSRDVGFADGGYFDNTGIATALSIIAYLEQWLANNRPDLNVKIELIRMLGPNPPSVATVGECPPEILLPLQTLYSTRMFTRDFYDRIIRDEKIGDEPLTCYSLRFDAIEMGAPLSWQLSRSTRERIRKSIDDELDAVLPGPLAEGMPDRGVEPDSGDIKGLLDLRSVLET